MKSPSKSIRKIDSAGVAGNGWRRSLIASLANLDVMLPGIMNGMLVAAGQSVVHAACMLSLFAIATVLVTAL